MNITSKWFIEAYQKHLSAAVNSYDSKHKDAFSLWSPLIKPSGIFEILHSQINYCQMKIS